MKVCNFRKRVFICFGLILLLFSNLNVTGPKSVLAKNELKIGDYVDFGTLYNSTIHWRVIYINSNGEALLWSEDDVVHHPYDGVSLTSQGDPDCHDWKTSNIRQWLNSSDKSIEWTKTAPNEGAVEEGHA